MTDPIPRPPESATAVARFLLSVLLWAAALAAVWPLSWNRILILVGATVLLLRLAYHDR